MTVTLAAAGCGAVYGGGGGGGDALADGPMPPLIMLDWRAASMRAARTQLGQVPSAERQVAQTGLRQPVQSATDGTA
jgi:hypothetical protein